MNYGRRSIELISELGHNNMLWVEFLMQPYDVIWFGFRMGFKSIRRTKFHDFVVELKEHPLQNLTKTLSVESN